MTDSAANPFASVALHEARVLHCQRDTSWATRVVVDVSACLDAMNYTTPGQFVALATPTSEARWFVISSLPSQLPTVEFLIGGGTEVSDALGALPPDAPVRISAAQGEGYPIAALAGRPVTGFVSGTGIASLRPVFDHLLATGTAAGKLTVYYQDRVRDAEFGECEYALQTALDAWRSAGVQVSCVCATESNSSAAAHEWASAAGAELGELDYLICGNAELNESVQAALERAGVPRDRVHRNY